MTVALTAGALIAYLAATFLFLIGFARVRQNLARAGLLAVWAGGVIHLTALLSHAVRDGVGALFAMPLGISVLALFLVIGYLVLERVYPIRPAGYLLAPLAAIALAADLLTHPDIAASTAPDALLKIHVALAFAGTACFALAFLLAVLYALQERQLKRKRFGKLFRSLPPLDSLDAVGFRVISVGFPIYTVAILLGFTRVRDQSDLAQAAIFLAVTTWLLYGLVLQARLTAGWRGRKAAVITIAGFLTAAGVVVAYLVR